MNITSDKMVIKVGKQYRTRNGLKLWVLGSDKNNLTDYAVRGVINFGNDAHEEMEFRTWTTEGKYSPDGGEHPLDIAAEWFESPVVDWYPMPAWAHYIAMDPLRQWRWYRSEPRRLSSGWKASGDLPGEYGEIFVTYTPTYTGPWQYSLIHRPTVHRTETPLLC